MKLSPDKDTVVGSTDRISNLPDSLLCHILCFLPTNEAIVTSILSGRWKPLWTLVPKIDLHDTSIRGHSVSPLRILYSVLAQHTTPILSNFTLSWHSPCDSSHFDKWIDTAISRNLRKLDLHIESKQLFELQNISVSGIKRRNRARSSSSLSTPKLKDFGSLRSMLYIPQLFLEPLLCLGLPEPRRFESTER